MRHRAGVFVGTGMGGIGSIDDGYQTLYGENSGRIKPLMVLTGMHNAPAAWIGIEQNWSGPSPTYSIACSSSAAAIGETWLRLASGDIALGEGAAMLVLELRDRALARGATIHGELAG